MQETDSIYRTAMHFNLNELPPLMRKQAVLKLGAQAKPIITKDIAMQGGEGQSAVLGEGRRCQPRGAGGGDEPIALAGATLGGAERRAWRYAGALSRHPGEAVSH